MTADEFDIALAVLIKGVGRPMPAEQVDVWRELFADMSSDDFRRGIVACLRDYRFAGFPPVGLIRQAAGVSGGVPDVDSAALLAWDKVLRAMREHGAYRSIQWDDPAIVPTIKTIAESWAMLCEQSSEQLHTWTKKAFVEAYKSHRIAPSGSSVVSVGLIASEAARSGYDVPEACRIGQETSATYGFLTAEPKYIAGPIEKLVRALPSPGDDEAEVIEEKTTETAEQFEARKRELIRRVNAKFMSTEELI